MKLEYVWIIMNPCKQFNNCEAKIKSNLCLASPETVVILCNKRIKEQRRIRERNILIQRILNKKENYARS